MTKWYQNDPKVTEKWPHRDLKMMSEWHACMTCMPCMHGMRAWQHVMHAWHACMTCMHDMPQDMHAWHACMTCMQVKHACHACVTCRHDMHACHACMSCMYVIFLIISGTQIVIFDARWQSGGPSGVQCQNWAKLGRNFPKKPTFGGSFFEAFFDHFLGGSSRAHF